MIALLLYKYQYLQTTESLNLQEDDGFYSGIE